MTPALVLTAVVLVVAITWVLPAPPAIVADADMGRRAFGCLLSAGLVAIAGLLLRLTSPSRQRRAAVLLATGGLLLGTLAFFEAARIEHACTAYYAGRPVVIGTTWTPLGRAYRDKYPELSVNDLLADSTGQVEMLWTKASIDRCRLGVSATYFLWVPLLTVGALGAVAGVRRSGLGASPWLAAGTSPVAPPVRADGAEVVQRYDAFISYRHGGTDARVAAAILEGLEAEGYAVAIDVRDFRANERFLDEMERCIRESRFTVALVSRRYVESGHCEEEAMICKVLDMGERRRRLVPIYLDDVQVPIWLHGLVGIRLDAGGSGLDPLDKLTAVLGPATRHEA